MNNYILIVLDSCRYDSVIAAQAPTLKSLGCLEQRFSYASWTAPSHFNLLMGLMPHTSPRFTPASESYRREFIQYAVRLGVPDIDFGAMLPSLYLPTFLRDKLGYSTHAMVSLPVLNPRTILNSGFDSYTLMPKHNDMRAMLRRLTFTDEQPSFYLLNVGETHYPYVLPDQSSAEWPRVSGVHGVFKHMGDNVHSEASGRPLSQYPSSDELAQMQSRQIMAVEYLDDVIAELLGIVPANTFITITGDHGELFGEDGYFGHGPISHPKVLEVPFVETLVC